MRTPRIRLAAHAGFTLVELLITSVIFTVILGLVVRIIVQTNSIYRTQRQLIEARDNASVSLDMIVRLVRMASTIDPDPDGDGILNRIRVEADWNPRNGVLTDPYETITFWSDGQRLLKQEPTDAAPVVFADAIQSVTFTYADTNNTTLTNPMASASRIAYVTVAVRLTTIEGIPGIALTSAAAVRRTE
jgi:prepilin-type N-terminal cleavage/methylation domain-containing protein